MLQKADYDRRAETAQGCDRPNDSGRGSLSRAAGLIVFESDTEGRIILPSWVLS
nr:hypothetical protein KPHV_75300 [Kitasatospora purpeofusca]